jgi:hypothetical protein
MHMRGNTKLLLSIAERSFVRNQHEQSPQFTKWSRPQGCRRTLGKPKTKIFAALSPREEMLLRVSFGIGSDADYTLSEINPEFSLPPQGIRQLQAKGVLQNMCATTGCCWLRGI